MGYMTNYLDKRLDPRLLMEGARSIISVAMNYTPAARLQKENTSWRPMHWGETTMML